MTLLVAWAGIDTHGPASVYIASDSRISWKPGTNFDFGRKVFAFQKWPDVLGYCGDVLFPSIALNQIVDLADAGLLFEKTFTCKQKFQAIANKLNDLFREYPQFHSGIAENSLSIIHCSRDQVDHKKFFCHSYRWSKKQGWYGTEVEFPSKSEVLFALGTGAKHFEENFKRYSKGTNSGTSRAVFHCFCDTLDYTTELSVGGAPQLVGIIRKPDSVAQTFGVIHKNRRYFLGAHIDNLRHLDNISWRNNNFEICDGHTKLKAPNAQPQPDPLRRL